MIKRLEWNIHYAKKFNNLLALSECSSLTCHEEASCLNITGVVKCHCGKGYVGDGDTCEEINPCLDNISLCHPQADCLHVGPGIQAFLLKMIEHFSFEFTTELLFLLIR